MKRTLSKPSMRYIQTSRIKRQGTEKIKHNGGDISNVIDEIDPDALPIFVARDIGKMPNIDFNHVDISSLSCDITLCKIKQ